MERTHTGSFLHRIFGGHQPEHSPVDHLPNDTNRYREYSLDQGVVQSFQGPRWTRQELEARKGRERSPEPLEAQIVAAIASCPELAEEPMRIECSRGIVTLTGEVANQYRKHLAAVVVEKVPQVQQVINLLDARRHIWRERTNLPHAK